MSNEALSTEASAVPAQGSLHTPGPWRERAPNIDGEVDEHYREITAGVGHFPDERGESGFKLTSFISPADARLIAAAPDLLEALKDAANELWSVPAASTMVLNKVRAAIAKAEGRS